MRVSFDDLPAVKFHAIRARIEAQADEARGEGNVGSAVSNGAAIEWVYYETEQRLVFTNTVRPEWMSESLVASRIRDLVEAVG